METKINENQEENQMKDLREEQMKLEWIYGCPLKLLSDDDKSEMIEYASDILGKHGEAEVKRLILEKRFPIIVSDKGNWYTEWYSDEFSTPVVRLMFEVTLEYEYSKWEPKSSCPEYDLREYLAGVVTRNKNLLISLAMQLMNEGEHSAVIERRIERLERLNTDLPFSPEEFLKIVN